MSNRINKLTGKKLTAKDYKELTDALAAEDAAKEQKQRTEKFNLYAGAVPLLKGGVGDKLVLPGTISKQSDDKNQQ
jgi:hypothetical protein